MRLSDQVLRDIAHAMVPYFSPITSEGRQLTYENMRPELQQAYHDGVIKHRVSSARSLRMIEQFYAEQ